MANHGKDSRTLLAAMARACLALALGSLAVAQPLEDRLRAAMAPWHFSQGDNEALHVGLRGLEDSWIKHRASSISWAFVMSNLQ